MRVSQIGILRFESSVVRVGVEFELDGTYAAAVEKVSFQLLSLRQTTQ
jgi:hypothetical protein